jgi:hypothetical protein
MGAAREPARMSELKGLLEDIRRGLVRNQQILRKLKLESLESRERVNRCHELIAELCAKLESPRCEDPLPVHGERVASTDGASRVRGRCRPSPAG